MTAAGPGQLWLLQLVPAWRWGRWLTGTAILALLLGWFWSAGILLSDDTNATSAAAVFFAVILAYIVPVFHYITLRTRQAFDELRPLLPNDADTVARWRRSIDHKSRRWIASRTGIGLLAWAAHMTLIYAPGGATAGQFYTAAWFAILAAPCLVWIVMTLVINALIDNARLFRRLAKAVQINLLNPAPLTAFARVAVSSTLAIVGAQAAFPIMWLDPTVALSASGPGLLFTTSAIAVLLILPIWPIHIAIAGAKHDALSHINRLLAAAAPSNDATPSQDEVAAIAPYLVYRREIAAVHEWPFDTGVATRLTFYLIIPPLTWVCAALIQTVVERYV